MLCMRGAGEEFVSMSRVRGTEVELVSLSRVRVQEKGWSVCHVLGYRSRVGQYVTCEGERSRVG